MSTIEVERKRKPHGVAVVWLARPKQRNALSDELVEALLQTFAELAAEPGVHCIVLAARGEAFCAGAISKGGCLLHMALCTRMLPGTVLWSCWN